MSNTPTQTQERLAWVIRKQVERLLWSREVEPTDDLETEVTNAVMGAVNQEGDNLSFTAFRNILTRAKSHLGVMEKHFNSPSFSLPELREFKVGEYVTLRAGTVFNNAARPNDDVVAQVRVHECYDVGNGDDDSGKVDRVGVYVEGLNVMLWLPGNTAAIKAEKPDKPGFHVMLEHHDSVYLDALFQCAEIKEGKLFLVEISEEEFQNEPSATYNEAYGWELSQETMRRYGIKQKVWEMIVIEAVRSEP